MLSAKIYAEDTLNELNGSFANACYNLGFRSRSIGNLDFEIYLS